MIIYQLYDSADKIKKYERKNTMITKGSIIEQKLNKLQFWSLLYIFWFFDFDTGHKSKYIVI